MVPAMTEGQDNRDTWFGDRRVGRDQKTMLVRDVFSSVADKYDLMNDLMSAGIHRLWKSAMIDWLNPRAGQSILDVGGGTGDIAFRILERRPDARITVCDLTPAMLDQGRDRAVDRGILSGDRMGRRQRRASAVRRDAVRRLHHRLLPAQRRGLGQGACTRLGAC